MTTFGDQLKSGSAYYSRATATTSMNYIQGFTDLETSGVPVAQQTIYFMNAPIAATATAIASTTATAGGTLTASGPLVSGGVGQLDYPRCLAITCTSNLATTTFTIRGTDGYGAGLTWSGAGPTTSATVFTSVAFKTVTTASVVGLVTSTVQIGTTDTYGLPYYAASTNRVLGVYVDGNPLASCTVTAGLTATGTATATTADVRGTVALATAFIANASRNYAIVMVAPDVNISKSIDDKEHTYGATPYSA